MKKLENAMKLPQSFKSESRGIASLATWYTQAPGQARYGGIDASVLAGNMRCIRSQITSEMIAAYGKYMEASNRFFLRTRSAAGDEGWKIPA